MTDAAAGVSVAASMVGRCAASVFRLLSGSAAVRGTRRPRGRAYLNWKFRVWTVPSSRVRLKTRQVPDQA
ncbi:hypothetical protein, partial [Streptomyces sp. NPDC001774]